VTAPTTEPAPPHAAPPARPAHTGLLRATAVIATIGVVVALVGVAILLLPVQTPTQDCGTSLGYLLDGRVDVLVSETDPPAGITPAEAKANNANPCRERVADRTKPAAVLIGAGLVAALGAALVEGTIRFLTWRKRGARRTGPDVATEPTDRTGDAPRPDPDPSPPAEA